MLKAPKKTVNVQALLDLADLIEQNGDMQYIQTSVECGTARCICGWQNWKMRRNVNDRKAAAHDLGLSVGQSFDLFMASGGSTWFITGLIKRPTAQDAARCLRELAMTGEVPEWWQPTFEHKDGSFYRGYGNNWPLTVSLS